MPKRLVDAHPERGLSRLVFRLPIYLYRARLGGLMGNRFLMLTHIGRKSGLARHVVLEVIRYDKATDTYIVVSAWGEKANWFRNIQQTPDVLIYSGRRRIEATAVRLSVEEAMREISDYDQRHHIAFRLIGWLMLGQRLTGTDDDFRFLSQSIPFAALLPRRLIQHPIGNQINVKNYV